MNYYIGSMIVAPYLEHHGILGMKWGQRNGPPYPLNSEDHSKAEKKAGWRKSLGDSDKEMSSKKQKSVKNEVSNKKKKEGPKELTDLERIQRSKRIATTIAVVGGVALATAAAYSLYDNYKLDNFDFILDSDVDLKRIANSPEFNEGKRAFYAAFDSKDVEKYKGLYGGGQLRIMNAIQNSADGGDRKVYQKTIDIVNDIKVPSRKTAEQVFKEMYTASGNEGDLFRMDFKAVAKLFPNNKFATRDDLKVLDMDNAKDLKSAYALFNQALVYHDDSIHNEIIDKFYDKLKSMGYGAVLDLNDRDFSGYKAKRPMIVFDTKSVTEKMVKELEDTELNSAFVNELVKLQGGNAANSILKMSTAIAAVSAISSTSAERKYKKEQEQTKKDDKKVTP